MKKMIVFYLLLLTFMTLASIIASYFVTDLHKIYILNIRNTLFTAFLTMGSFTLSLMTMFMFSLKDKLFDNEDYIKRIKSINETHDKDINRYKQLTNISRLFLFCVFCCFSTSVSQFTIGLIDSKFASSFCLALALSTICLALFVLFQVWKNLEVWFAILLKKGSKQNS